MKKYILTYSGSCTTFVTKTFEVEANSADEARQKVENEEECSKVIEHDIDDDYSSFKSISLKDG